MTTLKKFIRIVRDLWIIIGIAVVIFVAIDAGFSLVFFVRSFWHPPAPDYRSKADTHTDHSWVASYYQEHEEMGKPRWRSYVYWRRPSFAGKYININSDGLRKTYGEPGSEGAGPRSKVFMFGGSTMFGSGERDDFTIPSIFAKEIKSRGLNCEVVNYGQEAYVSTQEVIELMLQLQRGNIPDVVISYDGVNDTFGGFQLGVAGLPHNEFNREREFRLLEKKELKPLAVQNAIKQLSVFRFLNGFLKRPEAWREGTKLASLEYEKPNPDKGAVARAVVETYVNNLKLIQALSKSYGFKCLFYWQPTIYQKPQLTEYEREAMKLENKFAGMQEFYVETYGLMQSRAADLKTNYGLHDLSSIFNNVREPIFVDNWHLGEKGNSLIAKKMAADFEQIHTPSGGQKLPDEVISKAR